MKKQDTSAKSHFFPLLKKKYVLPALAGVFAMCAFASVASAEVADLRGYGKVNASISDGKSTFTCESEEKADILMGKLLADLFWDAGAAHVESVVDVQGKKMTVHEWKPYGAVVVARNKKQVFVVGADDAKAIAAVVSKEKALLDGNVAFKPARPFPRYLNTLDLESFRSYTHGLSLPSANILRWDFAKQYLTGGLSFQRPGFKDSLANGVSPWDHFDYELAVSEKEDKLYSLGISTGTWPRWAANSNPGYLYKESDTTVNSDEYNWYTADGESLGLTPEERRKTSLRYLGEIMRRYKESPVLGSWQFYCGSYYYETCYSRGVHGSIDYSQSGLEGYRRWLRDVRKFTLPELGDRWFGDSKHFKSWSDVMLPGDINGFFGNLEGDTFQIRENWSWRIADEKQLTLPAANEAGWISINWSPSRERRFTPKENLFYRTTFSADAWLAKNKGKEIYLSCTINNHNNKIGSTVWLNDKLLGEYKTKSAANYGQFALKVTDIIKSGKNELAFKVPKPGDIVGPIFLTTEKPSVYPYLGKQQNARYVDMMQWQLWGLNNKVHDTLEFARGIDPDRPMIIAVGSSIQAAEGQADACEQYGATLQMTGREAWYHPWWPRMGYIGGFYGTSEPSGPVRTAPGMNRLVGWMLQDGDASHMLFWDVDNYLELEKKTGWFAQNKRLLQLFGKYLPEKPKIVILRSSRTALLMGDIFTGMKWDIGRGEIQSSHFDNVYANESMVERGLVNDYGVLFDSGTEVMDASTVEAIRKYVENGGVFIAIHNTGKHDLIEADKWPVSKLTGFKVLGIGKKGNIKFENSLPVFKGWEGKEFEGEGSSLDFLNEETGKDVGLSLKAQESGTTALAKWDDGSVAIGLRKLGKGYVIILGSTFWRSGRDLQGIWKSQSEITSSFFERLFTDLGVKRNASASGSDIWTRKMITKNGLQEWLVAYNSSDVELKSNLQLATSSKPAEVWDLVEQKAVPFEYEEGWVKIKDVAMSGYGTKVYGVKGKSLAGGIDFWWGEKTKFWKNSRVKPLADAKAQEENPETILFEKWKFIADRDGSLSTSEEWKQAAFKDSDWKTLKTGVWNYQDDSLKDYTGTVIYRSLAFNLPANWDGSPVTFNISRSTNTPYFAKGEFYLNGVKIADFNENAPRRTLKVDVTSRLKKEGNVLSVLVAGRKDKDLNGLSGMFWLERARKFEVSNSLLGEWQAVGKDYLTTKPSTFPGKVNAKYVTRKFTLPADWKNRNIYLNAEFSENLDRIMVNGNPQLLYGAYEQINLTPYIRFDRENTLEIWTKNNPKVEEPPVEIQKIEIAAEAK